MEEIKEVVLEEQNETLQEKPMLEFLKVLDISIKTLAELNHFEIPREKLLDLKRYNLAQEYILKFKDIFSSSYLTSLQSNAAINQKWPLINLLRQILKAYGYQLKPKRKAAGYNSDGIKLYKRVFIINK
tara:strand:+ start:349 stop:735 length:387 start_codon:yes stop_codon:yes gene_type:complete